MKLALVAPSPVPFALGGAENLWSAWLAALNASPGVQAELIKLPSPEHDFWSIVASYRQFAALDLRHFDRIISTKYPAWMVAHPDHHVYLQHPLRGLYDCWPAGLSSAVPAADAPAVRRLLKALERAGDARSALAELFAALDALHAARDSLPPALFTLPGALLRRLVHGFDRIALARCAIRSYGAISQEVAGRADYFPPAVTAAGEAVVQHHPSLRRTASAGSLALPPGALFTASRLDGPKRLDLVIRAYQQAQLAQPLVIAGEGPQRPALAALAGAGGGDVRLLGRLDDGDLEAAYAQAAFVVFAPEREDYGLITLEALQAGRPVLTCSDSGGVLELVTHEHNGLVSAPAPAALGAAMRRLATEPGLCERLAGAARASVAHIQWAPLVARYARRLPRLLVVNTFSALPAASGGQLRLFHLYSELARRADVHLVNLDAQATATQHRVLAPGLRETLVPLSEPLRAYERRLGERLGASCVDLAAASRPELSPDWVAAIAEAGRDADAVILSHPYGWPALRASGVALPAVYEAHNVEVDLKAALFGNAPGTDAVSLETSLEAALETTNEAAHETIPAASPEASPAAMDAVAEVARIEGACARAAAAVLCCSAEDAARMAARYGLPAQPAVVPNGVAAHAYPAREPVARAAARGRLGLAPAQPLALFVGSLHGPNVAAARALVALARACPAITFGLLGSVCDARALGADEPMPPNLWSVGRVSHAELRVWLLAADAGLNPVDSGSGTNLKLLEYAAAGLPILSTPFGGRGGLLQPDTHFAAAALADFAPALQALLAPAGADGREARARAAQRQAQQAGDWRHSADALWRALAPLLGAAAEPPPCA